MRRRRALRILALGALASAQPLAAQRLPFQPGVKARVAAVDSASRDLWLSGKVLYVTRAGLLLDPEQREGDTVAVRFSNRIRLQVQRTPASNFLVGGGIGLAVGAALGATAFSSAFGATWGDEGPVGEIIGFGLLGAIAGTGLGYLLGPKRWEDIRVSDRGIEPAPLNRISQRKASFGTAERWQVFPPTEEDFAAFFTAWVDSLDPIEGIWELVPSGIQEPQLVAVVRDDRYPGYEYVAVRLRHREAEARYAEGLVVWVMRRTERVGEYEVRRTQRAYAVGVERAALTPRGLIIRDALRGPEEWVKAVPAPPGR
ncbi:hypothetical protein HRbin33_01630 [bacterium HR33]|nr:hypothetical protein HRbin33_01630 [bacterium HR33]